MNFVNILACEIGIGENTFRFLGNIFNWIQIVTVVLIIILGTVDFLKVLIASDDNKMKQAQKNFVVRLIIGVAIFFVFHIVQFLIILGVSEEAGACMDCLFSPQNCKIEEVVQQVPKKPEEEQPTEPEEEKNEMDKSNNKPSVINCRVDFEGALWAAPFQNNGSTTDFLGEGIYILPDDIPHSTYEGNGVSHTLDVIYIDHKTHLMLYTSAGDIVLDERGPAIILKSGNQNYEGAMEFYSSFGTFQVLFEEDNRQVLSTGKAVIKCN